MYIDGVLRNVSSKLQYCDEHNEAIKEAFDQFKELYFVDRGLGKGGTALWMMGLSFLNLVLIGLFLYLPSNNVFVTISELLFIVLFIVALSFTIYKAHVKRVAFDVYVEILQLKKEKYRRQILIYNEGASPATAKSIWYPIGVWDMSFVPGLMLTGTDDNVKLRLVELASFIISQVRDLALLSIVIGILGIIVTVFSFGAIRSVLKDLRYFIYNGLVAFGFLKSEQTTRYMQ